MKKILLIIIILNLLGCKATIEGRKSTQYPRIYPSVTTRAGKKIEMEYIKSLAGIVLIPVELAIDTVLFPIDALAMLADEDTETKGNVKKIKNKKEVDTSLKKIITEKFYQVNSIKIEDDNYDYPYKSTISLVLYKSNNTVKEKGSEYFDILTQKISDLVEKDVKNKKIFSGEDYELNLVYLNYDIFRNYTIIEDALIKSKNMNNKTIKILDKIRLGVGITNKEKGEILALIINDLFDVRSELMYEINEDKKIFKLFRKSKSQKTENNIVYYNKYLEIGKSSDNKYILKIKENGKIWRAYLYKRDYGSLYKDADVLIEEGDLLNIDNLDYRKLKKDGEWIYYNYDGYRKVIGEFKNGKKHGKFKYYKKDTKEIEYELKYINGIRQKKGR